MSSLFLLLCFSSFFACSVQSTTNNAFYHQQQNALLDFKSFVTNNMDSTLADWSRNRSICIWTGITCDIQLQRVVSLHLANKDLNGKISPSLSNISFLQSIDLSANNFGGCIPPQLGSLFRLKELSLHGNGLVGHIPSALANLSALTLLDLEENYVSGSIPTGISMLTRLQVIDMSFNNLEGPIPNSIANCTKLTVLSLQHNKLSGIVPMVLGNLSLLQSLRLSQNSLSGNIPDSLGTLQNLRHLDFYHNSLSGSIPYSLCNLQNLGFLNLKKNSLSGSIPDSLSNLQNLGYLNLYENSLSGSIPDSLCTLQNLGYLDLSFNSLGTIPVCLKKLKMLSYLNLQYNYLEGDVDIGGYFENSRIVILLDGNSGLCGSQVYYIPTCPTCPCPSEKGHSAFLRKVLGAVGGVIAFMFCCLLLSFLWARKFKRQRLDLLQAIREILEKVEYPSISYDELFIATNGFNQANFLGAGSFGTVYKGTLADGRVVAVKVLNLNKEYEKSFKAECKVLQNVRHRNLAKLITVCSNFHFKGLVFEFLSSGSLEEHLYHDRGHVSELGLKELLNIAIDIAGAVEYLHYDCYVQIVHCDIKPNNVLLDQDMTARLTDFGIARLMGGTSADSLTSTINVKGSVGYIAPEYGQDGSICVRGDVYSYGILLLEMITRKRPTDKMFEGDLNLHTWVNRAFPNQIEEVVDQSLLEQGRSREVEECVVSMLRIGLLCSKHSPKARPTMRDVSSLLKTVRENWEASTNPSKKIRPCITDLLQENSAITKVEDSSEIGNSSTF